MKKRNQYEKFRNLTDNLLAVPHAEIKTKLEAEKAAKRKKKESKVKRNDD